jgi:hypothetical protein
VKSFYLRWSLIAAGGLVIAWIAGVRYESDVAGISPDRLNRSGSAGMVRVEGRIEPGTLRIDREAHEARFELKGNSAVLPVRYLGDDFDNLRELKIVVLAGKWDPGKDAFESRKMNGVPNYGFIAAAYLTGLLPLVSFLFLMERKVVRLYDKIKSEKIYQAEESE